MCHKQIFARKISIEILGPQSENRTLMTHICYIRACVLVKVVAQNFACCVRECVTKA
jgi:hypothetical protein